MKNRIKELIKSVIPVLIGVLLALLIDNWNEERKDKLYIKRFYMSIRKEFKETDAEMNEKVPQQKMLLDSIDLYINDETLSLIQLISKGGGLSGPNISLNYWNSLSSSKIELIDYEKISILSDIEKGDELLNYKRDKLIDFVYANLTETGSKEKRLLKMMLVDVLNTEKRIQKNIRKILDQDLIIEDKNN